MINEKDLHIEYKLDRGKKADFVRSAIIHCECPQCNAEFDEQFDEMQFDGESEYHMWLTEKHLEIRNKLQNLGKDLSKYDQTIEFAKWVVERGIVSAHKKPNQFWFNTQDGSNPVKSMEQIFDMFKTEQNG